MILHTIVLTSIMLKSTRSSVVSDRFSTNTFGDTDYCQQTEYCPVGSHVMCMYHDHNRKMGHRCSNYIPTEINDHMVHQILESVNDIRSSLAHGHERGRDGHLLPRAYGMMQLEWDNELATFAQVLANQCFGLREDDCRGTDKFPRPSQITSLVNFQYPNWQFLKRNGTDGLNEEKLMYAIYKMFATLHGVKKFVREETIMNCPPLEQLPNFGSRSYLKLIQGAATHIGCGLSAYTRYHPGDHVSQNIYNSVQVVCNISEGPTPSGSVYTTQAPTPGSSFTKCGCPNGFMETSGCLCKAKPIVTVPKAEMTSVVKQHPWMEVMQYSKIKNSLKDAQSCDEAGTCRPIVVLPVLSTEEGLSSTEDSNEKLVSDDNYNKKLYHKLLKKLSYRAKEDAARHDSYSDDQNIKKPIRAKAIPETELNNAEESLGDDHQDLTLSNDGSNDDKMNVDVEYKKNDNKHRSLLDLLEQEARYKELSDKEMNNAKNTVLNNLQQTIARKPNDVENYFNKLKDYLKNKGKEFNKVETSAHESDPLSVETKSVRRRNFFGKHLNQVNLYKYLKRKYDGDFEPYSHGIDDKLIEILNSKSYNNNHINNSDIKYEHNFNDNNAEMERKLRNNSGQKYDYSLDHNDNDSSDRLYDDIDDHEFSNIPASRNQEKLGNYNNKGFKENANLLDEEVEYNKIDKYNNFDDHTNDIFSTRKNHGERNKKSSGDREVIKMPDIQTHFGRRKLSNLDIVSTTLRLPTFKQMNEKERVVRPNRPNRNEVLFGPKFKSHVKQRTYFANRATF